MHKNGRIYIKVLNKINIATIIQYRIQEQIKLHFIYSVFSYYSEFKPQKIRRNTFNKSVLFQNFVI